MATEEKQVQTVKVASGGVSFMGLLFILFLGLRLTGVINWSWWFITMPLWGGWALVLGIIFLVAAGGVAFVTVAALLDAMSKKKKKKK